MKALPPELVKSALAAHKWIGLLCAALMYMVCLSGTLAVFYPEFEQWEQPWVPESRSVDGLLLEKTFNAILGDANNITEHMYLFLPTAEHPRTRIANEKTGWFIDSDGSLLGEVEHHWTHMLLDLHLYLHMPENFGMIIVSLLGLLLCALVLTGLLAHPRIFKDAFSFRRDGSRKLEQTDLHNRLSVWGAPFHLMIGMTGAYFGLVGLLIWLAANALYDGDRKQVIESVFGAEPELEQEVGSFAVHRALSSLSDIEEKATPLFITFHKVGTPEQFMEIYASLPGRLIYSENYNFDASGNYLGRDGFSDGEVGKQLVYSIYRLHFGHFAGLPVKIIYLLLGLALTVISVSGVNIWLSKRKFSDQINVLWSGLVWGLPLALVVAAIGQVLVGISALYCFWFALAVAILIALGIQDVNKSDRILKAWCALLLLFLVSGHLLSFSNVVPGSIPSQVNFALLATTILLLAPELKTLTLTVKGKPGYE